MVLPSLLHASETWTVYSRHARQLNAFHMRCLRTLLHINWQDKVLDTEVLERSRMESIHAILMRTQLRWAGHVHRMEDNRLPKRLFYGELKKGKRSHGGQRKRFKDTLKASLKHCREEAAQDRQSWRASVKTCAVHFEAKRIQELQQTRQLRKDRSSIPSQPDIPCPHCSRKFKVKIGPISHLLTNNSKCEVKWSSSLAEDNH